MEIFSKVQAFHLYWLDQSLDANIRWGCCGGEGEEGLVGVLGRGRGGGFNIRWGRGGGGGLGGGSILGGGVGEDGQTTNQYPHHQPTNQ